MLLPALPGTAVKQHVFITAGLNDLLTDPESATEQRPWFVGLRAELDGFKIGLARIFCLQTFGAKDEWVARLGPINWGRCAFQSRHPKPGIQVIGGLAARDRFTALS